MFQKYRKCGATVLIQTVSISIRFIVCLLSDADWALGRLDGIAAVLPNPDLFVSMYVRQEAVLSSQIEGTQSTLEDVSQFEIDSKGQEFPKDIQEVVNYVGAMNYGLERLKTLPLSMCLVREIHDKLLPGVRDSNRTPGQFRTSQNWIGPNGCTLANAACMPDGRLRGSKTMPVDSEFPDLGFKRLSGYA